ncbi:GyrI-like domain-containing protein [Actinoplanes sp. NPDC024001]|uniref:GyrI-like domain-containing protein n=1 Tax=Actinoplanes sp. NPDC024001 TaxID=3154598 RepID=UPI0033CB7894
MEIIEPPQVVTLPERHYAGIRTVTPFKGMFQVRDRLMKDLHARFERGDTFFRLHVIDMAGEMDVEVGVVTDAAVAPDGPVRPGVLPAGDYATMTFIGHGRRANGTLLEWIRGHGLAMDCVENPAGDRFGCRYELYRTDPRTERMKTRWQTQLGIRLDS